MVNRLTPRAAALLFPAAAVLLVESAALGADPPANAPAAPAKQPEAPAEAAGQAAEAPAASKAWEKVIPTRRGGFTVGVMAGFGVASVVGFPNDSLKINRERYYTVTGVRPSPGGTAWFGAALTDWFTFGVGATGGWTLATGDQKVTTVGFVFHLEGFPLFPLGGGARDVGVMFDAGLGVASVDSKSTGESLVGGSGCSIIGGGVFYEGVRFWKIHGGPYLSGNYFWMDTVRRPGIFLGWRMALYTKP